MPVDGDKEILDVLRAQVKAEQEVANQLARQNDIAEESLRTLNRTMVAEQARTKLWAGISEQAAQSLPELVLTVHGNTEKLGELEEHTERYHIVDQQRFSRIEQALILLLAGNKDKAKKLVNDLEAVQAEELLTQYTTALHELKLKQAKWGSLNTPTWLLTEIADTELAINEAQERLNELTHGKR